MYIYVSRCEFWSNINKNLYEKKNITQIYQQTSINQHLAVIYLLQRLFLNSRAFRCSLIMGDFNIVYFSYMFWVSFSQENYLNQTWSPGKCLRWGELVPRHHDASLFTFAEVEVFSGVEAVLFPRQRIVVFCCLPKKKPKLWLINKVV